MPPSPFLKLSFRAKRNHSLANDSRVEESAFSDAFCAALVRRADRNRKRHFAPSSAKQNPAASQKIPAAALSLYWNFLNSHMQSNSATNEGSMSKTGNLCRLLPKSGAMSRDTSGQPLDMHEYRPAPTRRSCAKPYRSNRPAPNSSLRVAFPWATI